MNALISIIVPVYKSEKYVEQCIRSVICQTYSCWQLILVDDGSPDKSGSICDFFASKDSRIIVIHKENGGVSSARNCGIENASGSYVLFLDSDDLLSENCLSVLMNQPDIPDVSFFSFTKFDDNYKKKSELTSFSSNDENETLVMALNLKQDPYTSEMFCFPWNKMFRMDLLKENNIRFPTDICFREDEIFMYRYIKHCRSIKMLSDSLYLYRVSEFGLASRKRKYQEDIRLAEYIVEETKKLQCGDFFLSEQIKRVLLYYFSAMGNAPLISEKYSILKKMKTISSDYSLVCREGDRTIARIVVFLLKFPKVLCFLMMQMLGFVWIRAKRQVINV